jgi:hypothetical protein
MEEPLAQAVGDLGLKGAEPAVVVVHVHLGHGDRPGAQVEVGVFAQPVGIGGRDDGLVTALVAVVRAAALQENTVAAGPSHAHADTRMLLATEARKAPARVRHLVDLPRPSEVRAVGIGPNPAPIGRAVRIVPAVLIALRQERLRAIFWCPRHGPQDKPTGLHLQTLPWPAAKKPVSSCTPSHACSLGRQAWEGVLRGGRTVELAKVALPSRTAL